MKTIKSILFLGLIIFYAEASAGSSNNSTYLSGKSKIESIVSYLGMSEQQYLKFHAAVRGSVKAELLDSGFSYNDNAAVIELRKLLAEGLPIPESLAMEVETLFNRYRKALAKHSELTLAEFEVAEKKLVLIEMLYIDLKSISRGSAAKSRLDDKNQTVVIIRDEDAIDESSSGNHFITVTEIHGLGQPLLNGLGVNINVNFKSPSGGDLGTQPWRVTNSNAWSTGNIQSDTFLPL